MIFRFTRSLASLAILIVAYWLYALIAVPIIEPAAKSRLKKGASAADMASARNARSYGRKQLEGWFPPGSWELSTEMVLETPRGKLLLNQYEALPDGWLKFRPCTMVFMRDSGPVANGGKPNAPVILQVPDGAELKFDEPPDLQHGKIGNLVEGRLVGRFTIRSDQKLPGPKDDLLIVARDAELRDNRVISAHPMEFRLGMNHGSGRDIEIDLGEGTIGAKKEEGGLQLEGIKSFSVKRDVVVMLDAGRGGLMGRHEKEKKTSPPPFGPAAIPSLPAAALATGVPGAPGVPQELPLRIVCQGPFRFNMAALEASFEDKVDVLRLNEGGQSDRLQCQRLSMFFASSNAAEKPPEGAKPGSLGRLEPVRLEAYGQPVTVESPADDAEAVGEILRYNLKTKEVSLEGQHPVMLRRGKERIVAPKVQFRPSEDGRFGSFSATGPGKMEGTAPDDPQRRFAATWTKLLSFGPDGPNHVFSLRGDARAEMLGYGVLEADEIHVWVFERKRQAGGPPGMHRAARPPQSGGGMQNMPFTPQRMMAAGNVRLDAMQLTGRIGEMQIWFKPALPPISKLPDGRTVEELPPPPGAPRPAPAAGIPQIGGLNSRQRFNVSGRLLQAEVLVGPTKTDLGKLRIHDQARVAETQTASPQERPLLVAGHDIDYSQTDPTQGVLVVTGDVTRGKQGHIEGRGLALDGDVIRLDRGRNELTINGPGRLAVPIDQDLQGNPLASAQPVDVRWKGGLIFDGNMAHFTKQVACEFDNHVLRTEQLDVSFSERIDFANPPGQKRPELGALACHGAVTLDGRTFAQGKQTSVEHMQAFDLTFDRASGAVHATGPGEMTTVRLGALALGPMAPRQQLTGVPSKTQQVRRGPPARQISTQNGAENSGEELPSPAGAAASAEDILTYIHVAFPTEMRGTLSLTRGEQRPNVVQFSERVKTTYGPVGSWNGKIDADDIDRQLAAGQSAPSSVVLMNSDLLTVTQIPAGAGGKQANELEASGTVDIEGINFQKQNFFARADKLSYTDAKDLLILQGDGRAPAELAQQAPYGTVAGRKIFFWPRENRFKVDDAQSVDFNVPAGR